MKYDKVLQLHAVMKDANATVNAKADAILEAIAEHPDRDTPDARALLCSILDGFVLPKDRVA